jgi:cell division protein FtsB
MLVVSVTFIASAIFLPQAYYSIVEQSISSSSLGETLKTLDNSINSLREIQANGILNTILGNQSEDATPIVESHIYTDVINFIANAIRLVVLTMSFILLSFAVYSRFAFGGLTESSKLEGELAKVKKEIEELKSKSNTSEAKVENESKKEISAPSKEKSKSKKNKAKKSTKAKK